jgi:tripeptidyl-peptidase-2
MLYESPFEHQFVMVFDSKKKFIGASDAWPRGIKLPSKGTYTIRLQVLRSSPTVAATDNLDVSERRSVTVSVVF